eukprot:g3493.t1
MKPRITLAETTLPDGSQLQLQEHDERRYLIVHGQQICGPATRASEDELAKLAANPFRPARQPKIWLVGLGLGNMLEAIIRELPQKRATYTVAENRLELTEWNDKFFPDTPLNDPRVVLESDVGPGALNKQSGMLHAILIHLDSAPLGSRQKLLVNDKRWVSATFEALQPGGLLAIASTQKMPNLTRNLEKEGFSATALPEDSTPIQLAPGEWTNYRISDLKEHAAVVKRGDTLISFDPEEINRKIADLTAEISGKELQLQQAEADLATLQKTVPRRLAQLKRGAEQAAEELEYFNKTSRKSSEEAAEFALKRQQQALASTREELKQLLQMYEADDITEETEEIILQNQRNAVEYAEFALRRETLNHRRTLDVTIPRKAIELTEARDESALQLESGSKDLPRSIELKKIEIGILKTNLQRASETLKKLQADRKAFEFKASTDGIFYHGSMENGNWTSGDLVKNLRIGASPPLNRAFATFIPADTSLRAHAFLDQTTTLALGPGAEGTASLEGRSSPAASRPAR